MAQHHARKGLDFEILQAVLLRQRKAPDLRLRELNVLDGGLRQAAHAIGNLIGGQPERRRRPLIEFLRELAHRRAAARGDVAENTLDGIADLKCVLGLGLSGSVRS
jgi:hypothetical protein